MAVFTVRTGTELSVLPAAVAAACTTVCHQLPLMLTSVGTTVVTGLQLNCRPEVRTSKC